MANLALKYRPQTFDDVVEQNNVVKILEAMCNQPELPNRNFLLVGPRGCGKAQPLDSLVLTPTGYIQMGDVEVGTEVFTHTGKVAKVADVFPQGELPVYQILFDDGTYIEVADNHLNLVWVRNPETKELIGTVVETSELKRYFETLQFEDPYSKYIGVDLPQVNWEGEEINFEELSFEDIVDAISRFDPKFFLTSYENRINLVKYLLSSVSSGISNISELLRDGKLLVCASIDDYPTSSALSFLFRSLGCKDTVSATNESYRHVIEFPASNSFIEHPNVCQDIFDVDTPIPALKFITSITFIGMKECKCILVDDDDHTYITNGFVPTHNTTLGRIVANKLNDGQGSPIELDAASNSGVDTVRNIVSQAHLYPIGTKYKVFICDEVHSFSNSAWQALLLTLEEQPAKSVFILLTTNPEKIPATILSRVQKFQLSNISLDGLESRIKHVIQKENESGNAITYEDEAISFIARLAKGGMRDALTLLDKALVYSNEITSANLKQSLDIPEYDDYFDLLNAYAKKDNQTIMSIIASVYNSGANFIKWFEGFQSFVINIAKYVFIKDIRKTMIPPYYEDKLSSYNEKHAQICLALSQRLVDMIYKISRTEYMEEVAISYLCARR